MQDLRFTLRRAAAADVETLRRLAEEAFPATYREILSAEQIDYMMEWMYAREKILGEMAASTAWFVAEADGEPCGYLSVERLGDEVCILRKIYLVPRFQGCGGGEFLFRQAVACARDLCGGPCRMELHVNRRNRARGFYERMGMRCLRSGDFPIGGGYLMNDWIMGLEID